MIRLRIAGRLTSMILVFLIGETAARVVPAEGPSAGLVAVRPGLVVEVDAPKGWTHVVARSIPRLATGDLGSLPGWASRSAGLYRTVILADVGRFEGRYILRKVGVALCMPVAGRGDVVVRTGSLKRIGVSISTLEWSVLAAAESKMDDGRLVAATPSFALYRTPAALVGRKGEHRQVDLYYAMLVDPETGRLRGAVWALDQGARNPSAPEALVQLGPPPTFDCALDVEASRIAGLVPVSWSFAMIALPPGTTLAVPDPLKAMMDAVAEEHADPSALERALGDLLGPETIDGP